MLGLTSPAAIPSASGRRVALAAGIVAFGWLLPATAGAGVASLKAEVQAIAAELAELRHVRPVQADDPGRLARYEVRLGRLDEELRQLTGRIEELEHGQRLIQQRLDRLIGDLDARLGALEQGLAGATGGATEDTATAAAVPAPRPEVRPRPAAALSEPAESAGAAAGATAGAAAGSATGAGEGTLGTIPETALLNRPRPDPSTATPPPRGDLSAQEQYDAAMELLRAGDYAGAANGLELFLEVNPEHPLAANAAYWLAESHYVRQNYADAAAAFARNYRTYGKSAVKAPDNLLKLGMSLQSLGETEKACRSYEELSKEFPNAPAHIQQAVARERDRAECI